MARPFSRSPRPISRTSLLLPMLALAGLAAPARSENRTVVLLGDSLINRPFTMFNLSALLTNYTEPPPGVELTFVNAGNNGEEIASIYARTAAVLAQYQPWAVVLFWDSDCSNVDESVMSPAQVAALRANYSRQLLATERLILAATPRLAVAGPGLLGEGPVGLPARFANKTEMLDAYRVLTRAAAAAVGVPYVDMRQAFLDEVPAWWLIYAGWVTLDGEHPNQRGTEIEAELFATTINSWLAEEIEKSVAAPAAPTTGFLTRTGSELFANGAPFRWGSANIYWLGLDENEGGVHQPTHFRVTDALETIAGVLGSTLVRSHTLGISTGNALSFEPRLGIFNESALDAADWAIAEAERLGLRLMVPLTDNWQYYHGGKHDFTTWVGESDEEKFYTNAAAIAAFKDYVSHRLAHVNPYTGRSAINEPAIAIWETGNELRETSASWLGEIAALIKSLDPNHLVSDGTQGIVVDHLSVANVDIASDHFYPPDPARLKTGTAACKSAGIAYIAGEYGWSQGGDVNGTLAACVAQTACAATMAWSFFPHADSFGFVDHSDGFTIQYPGWGFASELEIVQVLRQHSAAMQGLPAPPPVAAVSRSPAVTAVDVRNNSIAWRGAALAAYYEVQTAPAASGPWTTVSLVGDAAPTDDSTPWGLPPGITLQAGDWARARGLGMDGVPGPWGAAAQ